MTMHKITIRRASLDDMRETWILWNNFQTRRMMKRKDYVDWDSHKKWFRHVLFDKNVIIVIGLLDLSHKLGAIRFNRHIVEQHKWEVSINLNPVFRGNGLGSIFLQIACKEMFKDKKESFLYAIVGEDTNRPSMRTFEKAGFVKLSNSEHSNYYAMPCSRLWNI